MNTTNLAIPDRIAKRGSAPARRSAPKVRSVSRAVGAAALWAMIATAAMEGRAQQLPASSGWSDTPDDFMIRRRRTTPPGAFVPSTNVPAVPPRAAAPSVSAPSAPTARPRPLSTPLAQPSSPRTGAVPAVAAATDAVARATAPGPAPQATAIWTTATQAVVAAPPPKISAESPAEASAPPPPARGLFFDLFRDPVPMPPSAVAATTAVPQRVVEAVEPATPAQPPPSHEQLTAAILLARDGEHEQAIRILEELIQNDPASTAAWEQLGWSYWAVGRRNDTVELWTRLLRLDPKNPVAYSLLARAAAAQGDLERAIEYNRKSLELAPNNDSTRYDLARTLLWSGRGEEALPILENLVASDPNRLDVTVEYARALTYAWQFEQALPLWARIREVAPDNESFLAMEAFCRLHTNDAEGARAGAEKVLASSPNDVMALETLASLNEFGSEPASAAPYLRRLIQAAPNPSEAERYRSRLIRLLVRLHKAEPRVYGLREAIDLCRERVEHNPLSVDARLLLGELLLMDGMLPDAEAEFIAVLRDRNVYNIRARKGLLEVYLAARQYDAAREQLAALSHFNPQDPYLLYHLARVESARGDFFKAHRALDQLEAAGSRGAVAVLLYHGLLPSRYFPDALAADRFREHMTALQKAGVQFVRCSELPSLFAQAATRTNAAAQPVLLRAGGFARPRSGRYPLTVAVSFDDARRDSMKYGTQIGRELGLTFSMHVPVGYIQQRHPFICSWDALREYQKERCWEFGGHMLEGAILAPVDASGRLWHALPNRIWRADAQRLETLEEYEQRLAVEFAESRRILAQELGGPTHFVAYPFGDIGQEDETNVDGPVDRILAHARRHFQVGFIQSVFGYAVAGDDPLLYQRHEMDRWMSGDDVVEYLYDHHPVFLARRLRAEFAALEGKLYKARDTIRTLEDDGYPDRLLARVRQYVEDRLARQFRTPIQGLGTIKKSPWTIEPRNPYVGVDGEYFRDNQDRRSGRIFGMAGLNVTPNVGLEARAGIGFLQQDVVEAVTNLVAQRRRPPATTLGTRRYRLDIDERDVGGRVMIAFPNDIYVAGEILRRSFSGDANRDVTVGSLEGQIRPVAPLDLLVRYERDMAPSALAVAQNIAYNLYQGVASVRLTDAWELLGSASRYDFTDDNVRDHLALATSWLLHERTGFRLGLRASYDTSDYDSQAYWTPYRLQRYFVEGGFRGNYLRSYYNVRLRLGIGKEDARPEEIARYRATVERARIERFDPGPPPEEDWEPVFGFMASTRVRIREHWVLHGEVSYNRNPNYNEISLLGGLQYRF